MAGCGPIQYKLTVSSTEGSEVIEPGEATFTYDRGTLVNLVAEADEGYQFVNWTGNVNAIADVNADATTITMNGDYSITANFVIVIEIWDWHDLDAFRDNLAGNYNLMNHLDSTTPGYEELAGPTAKEGKGWQPIGSWDARFTGSFDGQGYEIQDLFINRPGEDDVVGLFGVVEQSGIIKNIGVVNAEVTGCIGVGSLVGYNKATVSNSYAMGTVISISDFVGGLVGLNAGTVTNSYATASVTGYEFIGGFVGMNGYSDNPGTVSNSYSTGNMIGATYVGGLMGRNFPESIVSDSHATGNVDGDRFVGGLVGDNYFDVTDSYATGNVTGYSYVGGLVGHNSGNVSNCYATGSVTGDTDAGGLVGRNDEGTVSSSYSTGSVTGQEHVGSLLGRNGGIVNNSYASGSVIGDSRVGGLVGWNQATLSNSYSSCSVTGNSNVGGLVGDNEKGSTVSNSYSTGSVIGDSRVGGLVGWNRATLSNSYSSCSVTGNSNVGGLVGDNGKGSTVSNSYSTGSVIGGRWVGGLVGVNYYGRVSNSYSIGSITGATDVGGLVGDNFKGNVSKSFWDIETSGQAASDGGTGKTTAEMMDIATFTDTESEGLDDLWDIIAVGPGDSDNEYTWNIVDGVTYPFLSWQPV
jgi:hypothetical protein